MSKDKHKLFDLFFERFAHDSAKFLIPRMPVTDGENRRRIVDFAIVSHDPGAPRVAIICAPYQTHRTPVQEQDLKQFKTTLVEQNWVPVVFSHDDIEFRPRYVTQVLEDVFSGRKPEEPFPLPAIQISWRQSLTAFFQQRSLKNADVVLFVSLFTLLLAFSFITSLQDVGKSNTSAHSTYAKREVVVSASKEKKNSSAPSAPQEEKAPSLEGLVPVVDLENLAAGSASQGDVQSNQQKPKEAKFLATVRYCSSGVVCELNNNTKISLWGVTPRKDAIAQAAAMSELNALVAGRQIQMEVKETLSDRLLVKVWVDEQDVATTLVEKGWVAANSSVGDQYARIAEQVSRESRDKQLVDSSHK